MRNFLNPKWLLLLNTLPLVLLAVLCAGQYAVIHTLLPAESLQLWRWFALALAVLGAATLAYALVQQGRGRPLGVLYSLLALAAYSGFLLVYLNQEQQLIPWSVPRWMVPADLSLYVLTFSMPTLAHALFVLVVHTTPADRRHSAAMSFLLAFAAPLAWGIVLLLPFSFLQGWHTHWLWNFLFAASWVVGSIGSLFFIVRGAYIMGLNRAEDAELSMVWKVLISLLLPLAGLLLNNGLLWGGFSGYRSHEEGVFGNFHNPWFYMLAVLNGVLLCLPDQAGKWPRLLIFLGRSVLFSYTFYFFIVFLPYLPLSILAIILLGLGLLLLTPLILLVVHVRELGADLEFLAGQFPRRWLRAGLLAGVLTLPLIITARYWHNRRVLHQALAYRYTPDYRQHYDLDEQALVSTLEVVKQHKERANGLAFSRQVPYLATYFNWLVLDNLTISDDKIADLEQLFLGAAGAREPEFTRPAAAPTGGAPALSGLSARSTYDARQQTWVSWLDLRVSNTDTSQRAGEYATTLALPVGCWVGNYYLDMNGRREMGILAEKKAAAWVYAQIVGETQVRDPGLLAYTDSRHVNLRVYPVVRRAARTTGLQLLHKEPLTLTVDGRRVTLGDTTARPLAKPVATPGNEVVFVSAAAKQALPLVRRTPYYHFLLNVSAKQAAGKAAYARRIASRFAHDAAYAHARFTLVDAYATPVPADQWAQELAQHTGRGGFYLEGALRQVLFDAWQHPGPTYPVIVVVTDEVSEAILGPNLEELSSAYPESSLFYVLGATGETQAHSLLTNSRFGQPATPAPGQPIAVRAWPNAAHAQAYLPDNATADIVLNQPTVGVPQPRGASRWQTGLLLHGYQQWQQFHPEATEAERVPFVQASFRAGIMTRFTSYLALENEAQKAALSRKQQEVLQATATLDVDEGPAAPVTDVPIDGEVWVLLAGGLALAVGQLRRTWQVG
ncbi:MSEP-CTERM sorting domain-containing protein [Hymenobacter aquaticus]|nr:MSEP-CTERM sorting domain-containing protein [Hymenobacter aquaticus]